MLQFLRTYINKCHGNTNMNEKESEDRRGICQGTIPYSPWKITYVTKNAEFRTIRQQFELLNVTNPLIECHHYTDLLHQMPFTLTPLNTATYLFLYTYSRFTCLDTYKQQLYISVRFYVFFPLKYDGLSALCDIHLFQISCLWVSV